MGADVRHVPEAAVRDIYTARYWQLARCDDLPPALAVFHFDAAVNHGVTGATRLLHRHSPDDTASMMECANFRSSKQELR
ncbi:MAG: hypothetical protein GY877_12600 [Hyphomicrobium sp.]|nr:hypothetical protein [Hyphomicrobium sp.]